jgi:hypothetical protein
MSNTDGRGLVPTQTKTPSIVTVGALPTIDPAHYEMRSTGALVRGLYSSSEPIDYPAVPPW